LEWYPWGIGGARPEAQKGMRLVGKAKKEYLFVEGIFADLGIQNNPQKYHENHRII